MSNGPCAIGFLLVAHGIATCVDEMVRGYGCLPDPTDSESFTCSQILEIGEQLTFPTTLADEYSCLRCRSNETDGMANSETIRNCTLFKTCSYDNVIVDDCRVGEAVNSLACSSRDLLIPDSSETPLIKCTGGVCSTETNEQTVDSPVVYDCKKCYSSDLIAVNCATEPGENSYTCNQYFTFDAVQVVTSQAGVTYTFTSGAMDTIYTCKVIMCVDSSGTPAFDLSSVKNCSLSNPPLGQGYQSL
jgi:hypothetical protein